MQRVKKPRDLYTWRSWSFQKPVTRRFVSSWQVKSDSPLIETHSQESENAKPDTDPTKVEVKVRTMKKRLDRGKIDEMVRYQEVPR